MQKRRRRDRRAHQASTEMAACSCGRRWTRADLHENPNAADEHECALDPESLQH